MVYGLLGKGISHSFSKTLHSYLGDYQYDLFDLGENDAKKFILSKNYCGLNITMPYKKLAYSLCDVLSDTAKSTGSVNTIVVKNDLIYGFNTDYDGFKQLLIMNNIQIAGKKIVVLGSGGASNTICTVLNEMNAKCIEVISRNGENNYQNIQNHYNSDIIINTTPIGMYSHIDEEIIDTSKFTNCTDVIDIIYNPLRTRLLCKSKLCGKNTFNGLSMLVYQGIVASKIWGCFDVSIHPDSIVKSITNHKRNIVLIGMPGVGKSTIGYKLAKKLNMNFVDTDDIIHNFYGKSCEEIIKTSGEEFFRTIEKNTILNLCNINNTVIATGGGVVLNEENMLSLMANGVIVLVKRDFRVINQNIGPVLRANGIEMLYKQRKEKYKKYCDFEIHNDLSVDDSLQKIISLLNL